MGNFPQYFIYNQVFKIIFIPWGFQSNFILTSLNLLLHDIQTSQQINKHSHSIAFILIDIERILTVQVFALHVRLLINTNQHKFNRSKVTYRDYDLIFFDAI